LRTCVRHRLLAAVGSERTAIIGGSDLGLSAPFAATYPDLVVGSGLRFADRGDHVLRGVPDLWRLYALER
jgi:hypothetical protein